MKIAICVNGEGFGHASRAVTYYEILSEQHDLVIFAPKNLEEFFAKKIPLAKLERIPGMFFVKKADKVSTIATLIHNWPIIKGQKRIIANMAKRLEKHKVQALISDFEPIGPRAAFLIGIPVLQINHPGVILESKSLWPDALMAKQATRLLMGPYTEKIICSFYQGDVGPLLRDEIVHAKTWESGRLLVSLKDSFRPSVLGTLDKLGITDFDLFPTKGKNYAQHLAGCRALITSAGHQSMSEALFLKKPILVIPQKGQYEQRFNARYLKFSGGGDYTTLARLEKDLPRFLANLESFTPKAHPEIRFSYQQEKHILTRKIMSFLERMAFQIKEPQSLMESWEDYPIPPKTSHYNPFSGDWV